MPPESHKIVLAYVNTPLRELNAKKISIEDYETWTRRHQRQTRTLTSIVPEDRFDRVCMFTDNVHAGAVQQLQSFFVPCPDQ